VRGSYSGLHIPTLTTRTQLPPTLINPCSRSRNITLSTTYARKITLPVPAPSLILHETNYLPPRIPLVPVARRDYPTGDPTQRNRFYANERPDAHRKTTIICLCNSRLGRCLRRFRLFPISPHKEDLPLIHRAAGLERMRPAEDGKVGHWRVLGRRTSPRFP
jgi:hypothetical protein